MSKMKKNRLRKAFCLMAIAFLVTGPATAQVFIMEEESNSNRDPEEINGFYGNVIYHGLSADQPNWVPLGSGAMLLATLGGAYLIAKKKNNN